MGVKKNDINYDQAQYLINFLDNFETLDSEYVNPDCLLREFIGKSYFE
jgi:hypothetical protein